MRLRGATSDLNFAVDTRVRVKWETITLSENMVSKNTELYFQKWEGLVECPLRVHLKHTAQPDNKFVGIDTKSELSDTSIK